MATISRPSSVRMSKSEQARQQFVGQDLRSAPGDVAPAKPGIMEDYLRRTSFYGLQNILRKDNPPALRLFWFLVLTTMTVICCVPIVLSYNRMSASLIDIGGTEKASPMWSVPFPAITVCPQRARGTIDDEECPNKTIPMNSFCASVCWHNECSSSCETAFQETRTENGHCYTFNAVSGTELFNNLTFSSYIHVSNVSNPSKFWSLENGYDNFGGALPKYYPEAAYDLSSQYHLRLTFNGSANPPSCQRSIPLVYLHSPADFPYKASKLITMSPNSLTNLRVTPKVTSGRSYLRYYTPSSIGCYFQSQNPLQFFRIYTQSNCELECHANYYLMKRGCVLDHMPKDQSTRICNNSNYQPYDIIDKEVTLRSRAEGFPRSHFFRHNCNCLPACFDLQYGVSLTTETLLTPLNVTEDETLSKLVVAYDDDHFYHRVRSVKYGFLDFAADTGGYVALFLGVSVLTVFELFYYCLLKPAVT